MYFVLSSYFSRAGERLCGQSFERRLGKVFIGTLDRNPLWHRLPPILAKRALIITVNKLKFYSFVYEFLRNELGVGNIELDET